MIEQQLEKMIKEYYELYPYGHSKMDAYNEYSKGRVMWDQMISFNNQHFDSYSLFEQLQIKYWSTL